MLEVINITEQLILQLWIVDNWDRTVLVECSGIALKTRGEVSKMSSNLLYHKTPKSYKVWFNTCQAILSDCTSVFNDFFRKGFP